MIAQFAVVLLRVPQPLHEAFLVDELYGTCADAWMVQRTVGRRLGAAYPTYFCQIIRQEFKEKRDYRKLSLDHYCTRAYAEQNEFHIFVGNSHEEQKVYVESTTFTVSPFDEHNRLI